MLILTMMLLTMGVGSVIKLADCQNMRIINRFPRSPQEDFQFSPSAFRPRTTRNPVPVTSSTLSTSTSPPSTQSTRPTPQVTIPLSPFVPLPPGPPPKLRTVFEWRELEFLFPNETARNAAIADQSYIRGNSVPIDIQVYYGGTGPPRYFVTVPRFNVGRPMTLTTVAIDSRPGPGGPFLRPYPEYSWQVNPASCEGIVSVYRIAIDICDRLWVLDSGRIGGNQLCPPQLLVFDLKTDRLIHRHRFAPTIYRQTSVFINVIPDIRDAQCRNTFVYIGDIQGFGLIVYDHARNSSWRIDNKLFYPFPSSGTHRIAGEQFELMDGMLGMALGPLIGEERFLYFHALASVTQNRVATSVIRNSTIFERNSRSSPLSFQVYNGRRSSQSAASAIDSSGTLYFGLNEDVSIACWHSSKAYVQANILTLVQDNTTLQFASGVKIIVNTRDQNKEELWLMTNRFQKYMTGTLNSSSINFRALVGDAKQLSRDTVCQGVNSEISAVGAPEEPLFVPVINVPDQVNYLT